MMLRNGVQAGAIQMANTFTTVAFRNSESQRGSLLRSMTIGAGAARTLVSIALLGIVALSMGAKSIFDDDWTPPAPRKPEMASTQPAAPVVPTSTTGPVEPVREPPRAATQEAKETGPTTTGVVVARSRHPVPASKEQAQARKLFKEIFAAELAEHSVMGRRALGQKLLLQAARTTDAPVDEFVLLMGATEAGREGADLSLSFRAADQVSAAFEVDALSVKAEAAIGLAGRVVTAAEAAENIRLGLSVVEQLIDQEDYATAARVVTTLRAGRGQDAAIGKQITSTARRVDLLRTAATAVAKERDRLKSKPDDAAANLAVGRFFCFGKGDWQRGLPLLAKSADPSFHDLAVADLASPTDAAAQATLADHWWDAAAKEPLAAAKWAQRQRAAFWYESALPGMKALRLAQVEQRLAEFARQIPPELSVVASQRLGSVARPFAVASAGHWIPVEFEVTAGHCYQIVARGLWTDSTGAVCDANGICPAEFLTLLGWPPNLSDDQRRDWYIGQHPRSSLLARIGEDKLGFFVGVGTTFLAPASGKLSFRINDGDSSSESRAGRIHVAVNEVEPHWLDDSGSAAIVARIDAIDMLHITADGLYWEWGGQWGKVGEHDGHYPTVINGILWWPKWTEKMRSETLKLSDLRLKGSVRLVRVDAKRGDVTLMATDPSDTKLRFIDHGGGSSQVGCVIAIGP
jgi:hypothetical protein